MGYIKQLKCQNCSFHWHLNQGVGMSATYLYCNKCGDQQVVDYPIAKQELVPEMKCKCGGTYEMDLNFPFVCPQCKSNQIEVNDAGFWD